MGEDLRQLGHVGKHHRLAQGFALCPIGQREAAAKRKKNKTGKNRPPGRNQQQAGAEHGRE